MQAGDTFASVTAALASEINADTQLNEAGIRAFSNGAVITASSTMTDTTYWGYVYSGAGTEIIVVTSVNRGTCSLTLGGTLTVGDTLYLFVYGQNFSHTVASGDTLSSIASTFATQVNANSTLAADSITALSVGPVISFVSYAIPPAGYGVNLSSGATETMTLGPVKDDTNQTYNYQYNSIGHVTQSNDPSNRTFSYSYASNGIDLQQITETQYSDNFLIGSWTYNSQHRPLTYTDGSGQVTQYAYNSSGQLVSITDANSNVTTLTYTGTSSATIGGSKTTGNTLTITVHDAGLSGGQKSKTYTVLSGDTLATIAAGLAALINGDSALQTIGVSASSASTLITLTSTSVNVTTYSESTSGGATETITLGANTYGYLTQIDGPLAGHNDITTFAYDSYGRLSQRTDSEGYTISYNYDAADRLTQTTYPDSTTEQIVYDKLDAVQKKDRIGRWTRDCFDNMDRIVCEIDPLSRETQYCWCDCGSLASLTDPNGNVTTWHHDLQGRPISKVYPDGSTVSYTYEPWSSRLRTKTDALSQITVYTYNSDDTPCQVGYQNAVNATAAVNYAWDQYFKRISSITKGDWGALTYTYNPYIAPGGTPTTGGGMLAEVQNSVIANSNITYSYDVLGRTTNRSINGSSNSITWSYDAMSRITSEANALGTFGYSYVDDVSGSSKGTLRLSSISYPNGQVNQLHLVRKHRRPTFTEHQQPASERRPTLAV